MSEKMIKISAVFKVKSEDEELLVEMTMNYDAEKASKNSRMSKLELYDALKKMADHQVKKISPEAEVLDATAAEVKEHYAKQE